MRATVFLPIIAALLLVSCAPQGSPSTPGASDVQPAARKRITAAINSTPATLSSVLELTLAGTTEIETLIHGGFTAADSQGVSQLQIGETIPTIENGLWKLLPDGRMETTWRIKPGVVWHDGAPFTTDDLAFSLSVYRDREVPFFSNEAYGGIDNVSITDAQTVVVGWKSPFINADRLFGLLGSSGALALPMPKHLLEQPYRENKAGLNQLSYWSDDFVGAGPFKVREFARGRYLRLDAFDRFILGRPKIDEVEIRFIPDVNAFIANVLAGEVDLGLGRALSFEQGQAVREQWRDGRVEFAFKSVILIYPQFLNANPAVMTDVRFRRALYHGLDREEMVNTLMGGLSSVAHFRANPKDPDYQEVLQSGSVVQYAYDPRRSAELLQELGYARNPAGQYQDSANRPLNIEIRTGSQDYQTKPMFVAADSWRQLGIGVDPVVIPEQRARDLEYRATFPGFELVQQPTGFDSFGNLQSNRSAVPENKFQVSGKNYARYMSPELDNLVSKYFLTVPKRERAKLAEQIVHHVTDQAVWISLYYSPDAAAIGNRLLNTNAVQESNGSLSWNAQEWDLR